MDIGAVVVSYNSGRFLPACIASLQAQDEPFSRIVVVDNCSQDDSVVVSEHYAGVQVQKLARNVGYAAAANRGIEACASHQAVLVANADTVFPADFTRQVRQQLQADPTIGLLAPLLLRFDGQTIDSAGQACSSARYPREIGYNRPRDEVALPAGDVFSVCGAAAVFTRAALSRLRIGDEYYDEDFFMFWEDFDIGWRAQLLGIRVYFAPRIMVRHYRSGTLEANWRRRLSLALSRPPSLRYHLVKNRYLCLIKNFRWRRDWRVLPLMLLKDLAWVGALTISSPKNIMALMRIGSLVRKSRDKRKWIKSHE